MKKRVLVGIPLALLMLAVVLIESRALMLIIVLFACMGQIEMFRALRHAGYTPTFWTSLIFVLLLYPTNYFFGINGVFLLFAILTGLNMCWAIFFPERQFMDIIMSEFMLCYPALPFYFLIMIKTIEPHVLSIVAMSMVLIIASLNDMLALFVGKKFGKNKLSPVLSPNKTVEGAIGGITGSVIIGFIILLILQPMFYPYIHWAHLLICCILSSVFATAGDLIASAVKRFCGIKDFGNIFPGHGGVLDRLDSYLLSAIAIYTYYSIVIL